jgi:hypothetical protein
LYIYMPKQTHSQWYYNYITIIYNHIHNHITTICNYITMIYNFMTILLQQYYNIPMYNYNGVIEGCGIIHITNMHLSKLL